ncbi:hypothetical protein Acy02nite_12830 [Actinoplanes cyaneus]|uniref:Uncharacterized protein n=1 Tax=Actinoplanes cyaneus TaxID=52696 RepID=A0A919IDG7_9ACTN|nr:hypothetical protein [Actinoplanes cyaneus]MCW2137350.1 hypothetical protein [Actinoplanes cyaneus]GID63402.1 hypothetical protein Acy02nite_12830 [Actinoplanes cyaneus]
MSVLHSVLDQLSSLPLADTPDNPAPKAPPGAEKPINQLMGYLKWGVLAVIIAAGFVGAGAIAGGRIFANHGASKVGVGILLSALGGAVVFVGVYSIITAITNG